MIQKTSETLGLGGISSGEVFSCDLGVTCVNFEFKH